MCARVSRPLAFVRRQASWASWNAQAVVSYGIFGGGGLRGWGGNECGAEADDRGVWVDGSGEWL